MNGTATTTLEQFAECEASEYATLPTHDVEILPDDTYHCAACGHEIAREQTTGQWHHSGLETASHEALPSFRCPYCKYDDPALVTFATVGHVHETRCARCGGIDAATIGN